MQAEGEHADGGGEQQAEDDALEHDARAEALAQALQEDHDLEALAVDGGEAEQAEAEQRGARERAVAAIGRAEQPAPALVVVGDPAGPVELVEEPVHHEQQHDDRGDAGGRLHRQAVAAEHADDPDRQEPGRDRGQQREPPADGDGLAVGAVGAEEARGDRRQHEDRLQALAEDEHAAVDHRGRGAHLVGRIGRVGRAAASVPAEDHARHADRRAPPPSRCTGSSATPAAASEKPRPVPPAPPRPARRLPAPTLPALKMWLSAPEASASLSGIPTWRLGYAARGR